MLNELRIEKLTRQGIALMQEEREAALKGDANRIGELNAKKADFLSEMESLAEKLEAGGPLEVQKTRRQELSTLFEIMQRRAVENQALLRASSAGVRSAKQQIAALAASSQSIGAYNSSGEPVNHNNQAGRANQVF